MSALIVGILLFATYLGFTGFTAYFLHVQRMKAGLAAVPLSSSSRIILPIMSVYWLCGPCGGPFVHAYYDSGLEGKISRVEFSRITKAVNVALKEKAPTLMPHTLLVALPVLGLVLLYWKMKQTERAVNSILQSENIRYASRGVRWVLEQSEGHCWISIQVDNYI